MTQTDFTIDTMLMLARARRLSRSGEGRRLREAAGLSVHDVARAADTTAACVSRYERGDRVPHGDTAIRWARVCAAIAAEIGWREFVWGGAAR
jgi:predicted transcriptional regulator